MLGESGQDQFVQSNIAIWILTCASAAFLFVRLYCRLRFSSVWWDDFVLTVSWVRAAPISRNETRCDAKDRKADYSHLHIVQDTHC
jgi:hypothetical protein